MRAYSGCILPLKVHVEGGKNVIEVTGGSGKKQGAGSWKRSLAVQAQTPLVVQLRLELTLQTSASRSQLPVPSYGIGASLRGNSSSRIASSYAVAATTTADCIKSSISMWSYVSR